MRAPAKSRAQTKGSRPAKRHWTASELLRLPPARRDAILRAAAAKAEAEYRANPALTDFAA